jgi:PAS domain S-box-containing protein
MVVSAPRTAFFQPKLSFNRGSSFTKGLVLVSVPLISEVLCIAVLCLCLLTAKEDLQNIDSQRRVLFFLKSVDMECARSLLPMLEAKDISQIRTRLAGVRALHTKVRELSLSKQEVSDSSLKTAVDQASDMIPRLEDFLRESEERAHEPGMTQLKWVGKERGKFLGLMVDYGGFSRSTVQCETATRARTADELQRIRFFLLAAIGSIVLVNAAIAFFLVRFFTKDIVDRLNRVAENAHRLAFGKPLLPALTDSDEIGALDRELFGAAKSLTDARRKELAVLDSASDAICWLDQNLRFVLVSQAAEVIWQLKLDDLLGASLLINLDEASIETTRQSFQAIRERGNIGLIENVLLLPDGKRRTLSWKVVWSPGRRGFFCVARDVSGLKAVQVLKQSFLAMVSHDIRAPLSSLATSIELLLAGKTGRITEAQRAELKAVDAGTRRLKHLADELLDLGRLESGKETLRLQPVHAFNVCARAKEALLDAARQAKVSFVGPADDALLLGDETRLVQAITNLLSYALKVSPEASKVLLRVHTIEKMVEIRVRDQGPGIAPDDLPLIFQKFQRTTENSHFQDTGLELAMVKAVVQAHDGQLGVSNEPGGGTTFWIRLAASASPDDEEEL